MCSSAQGLALACEGFRLPVRGFGLDCLGSWDSSTLWGIVKLQRSGQTAGPSSGIAGDDA